MPMQLILDFTPRLPHSSPRLIPSAAWLDVSEIARGVGFSNKVEISLALRDALEPTQSEQGGDYDQRLYDALWLAHFQLSLDCRPSTVFTFAFPRKRWKTEETMEASLRLRVEAQPQSVLVGLLPDF